MDKQKQMIEEMAMTAYPIYATMEDEVRKETIKHINGYEAFKRLCEAGYRKIPEGVVLLTREEYEKLCDLAYFGNGEETIRKETAEKFAEMANKIANNKLEFYGVRMIDIEDINEICKELIGDK